MTDVEIRTSRVRNRMSSVSQRGSNAMCPPGTTDPEREGLPRPPRPAARRPRQARGASSGRRPRRVESACARGLDARPRSRRRGGSAGGAQARPPPSVPRVRAAAAPRRPRAAAGCDASADRAHPAERDQPGASRHRSLGPPDERHRLTRPHARGWWGGDGWFALYRGIAHVINSASPERPREECLSPLDCRASAV